MAGGRPRPPRRALRRGPDRPAAGCPDGGSAGGLGAGEPGPESPAPRPLQRRAARPVPPGG